MKTNYMPYEEEVSAELQNKRWHVGNIYKIASKAIHITGEISRDTFPENVAIIESETDNYYIGKWRLGFEFKNVLFSKETTRDLTPFEVEMMKYYDK